MSMCSRERKGTRTASGKSGQLVTLFLSEHIINRKEKKRFLEVGNNDSLPEIWKQIQFHACKMLCLDLDGLEMYVIVPFTAEQLSRFTRSSRRHLHSTETLGES